MNREIIIKLNIKKGKQHRWLYSPSIQIFIKIQTKQKSAKLKINLINTTMEQNRAQEIVKKKWKIREKGRKTLNLNWVMWKNSI